MKIMKASRLVHESMHTEVPPALATAQRKATGQPLFRFQCGTEPRRVVDDTREDEGEDGDVPRALDHAGHQGSRCNLSPSFRQGDQVDPCEAEASVFCSSLQLPPNMSTPSFTTSIQMPRHHKCGSMLDLFKIG